jgi:hypothetical protein
MGIKKNKSTKNISVLDPKTRFEERKVIIERALLKVFPEKR